MTDSRSIIITGPSLDPGRNIGGISSVVNLIISNNKEYNYKHFELGKHDNKRRSFLDLFRVINGWIRWVFLLVRRKDIIIHFNISLEKRSLLRDTPLVLIARLLNRRMVIHLHGGMYMGSAELPLWVKRLTVSVLSGKEPKIVLSANEQDHITKKFGAENIFILPNGVELSDAKVFKRLWPASYLPRLLFISRIVKAKGIDDILLALKQLSQTDIPFHFTMAGDGEDRDEYVRKFTECLEAKFTYQGVVSGNVKSSLFRECNIFLLPSHYEGLPVSLLESMSYALVPIVTDVGSIKNVVTDGLNGIIVKKNSYEDIYNAIIRLVREKGLINTMGNNARNYIFENFSTENYMLQLNKIYMLA
jgi:glycosyltransferase involved in cell wall biosynthesis